MKRIAIIITLLIISIQLFSEKNTEEVKPQMTSRFFLEFGAGFSKTEYKQTISDGYESITTPDLNETGIVFDVRLGNNFEEKKADMYFMLKFNIHSMENIEGDVVSISNSLLGVGSRLYINKDMWNSPFVELGGGYSTWTADGDDDNNLIGYGCDLGIGFRVKKNHLFKVNYFLTWTDRDFLGVEMDVETKVLIFSYSLRLK